MKLSKYRCMRARQAVECLEESLFLLDAGKAAMSEVPPLADCLECLARIEKDVAQLRLEVQEKTKCHDSEN